jgi:hypothetical protein
MVRCHLAALTLIGLTRRGREIVPDAGASAILVDSSFNLIRGCSGTPEEMLRESLSQVGFDLGLDRRSGSNAHVFSCSLFSDTI